VDVGGTLTKLVYFEPNDEDEPASEVEAKVLKNIRRYLTKNSAYGKTGHRDIHLQVLSIFIKVLFLDMIIAIHTALNKYSHINPLFPLTLIC